MIKNFHSLTDDEYRQFVKFYIDYFKNHLVYYRQGVPKRLNPLMNRIWAKEYVRVMLERIDNRERTCLVSLHIERSTPLPDGKYDLQCKVDGFVTGHGVAETKEGWISHFHVEDEHHPSKRQKSLELCREFANIMRSEGMKTIAAKTAIEDPKLVDTLESLDFHEKATSADTIEYEKRI